MKGTNQYGKFRSGHTNYLSAEKLAKWEIKRLEWIKKMPEKFKTKSYSSIVWDKNKKEWVNNIVVIEKGIPLEKYFKLCEKGLR